MTGSSTLDPLTLPLRDVRLIEASAGTGKTYTIAALYLRLVLGHREDGGESTPLLPPQILVVTFTRAATAELRERIRRRLAEAADCFRGIVHTDDALLQRLLDARPQAAERLQCAARLDLAVQWMDEAAIFTIHGFCQRMLSQHAFESDRPFEQSADADDEELRAEALRDYWRRSFYSLDEPSTARVLGWWRSPEQLGDEVRGLLAFDEGELRWGGQAMPRASSVHEALAEAVRPAELPAKQRARADVARGLHEAMQRVAEAKKAGAINNRSLTNPKLAADTETLRRWADDGQEQDTAVLAALERYTPTGLAKLATAGNAPPEHPMFSSLADYLAERQQPLDARALLGVHARGEVLESTQRAKQTQGQVGFDDMLTQLDAALRGRGGPELAATLRTQYPLAMIDEFQDTDPTQWRIFSSIYAEARPGSPLPQGVLLIGDPKQAIYKFRGADIHTYLAARASATERYTLGRNFRSSAAMVEAVNQLFAHADTLAVEQGAFALGRGAVGLPFEPVQSTGDSSALRIDGRPVAALRYALCDEQPVVSFAVAAEACAEEIARLLLLGAQGRCGFAADAGPLSPLRPNDVAVLVRRGTDAEEVARQLRRRGVRSVYLSDKESVFSSREARDLRHWLRAALEPASDSALRAALATDTFAYDYADLERLEVDEIHHEHCVDTFRALNEQWRRHGVLSMVHALLFAFGIPQRLLGRPRGERALTNVLHVAELLQQAATSLDGQRALLRHLDEQLTAEHGVSSDAPNAPIVRLESEADLVKIVTVHKSKGMEYPLVFLPAASAFREVDAPDKTNFYSYQQGEQRVADLSRSVVARQRADQERLQEDIRLLYVALTRARYACWAVATPVRGKSMPKQLQRGAFGHLLAGGASLEPERVPQAVAALCTDPRIAATTALPMDPGCTRYQHAAGAQELVGARRYTGAAPEPWWIASYSALKHAELDPSRSPLMAETARDDVLVEEAREPAPVAAAEPRVGHDLHDFPRGAEPGTFLHGLLELAAELGFARVAEHPELLEDPVARRCQRRGWQAWIGALQTWLPALLDARLRLPGGADLRLAELEPSNYRAELEFWFEAHHVDAREIDRLVTAHTLPGVARPPLQPSRLNGMLKGFIDLVFEHAGRWYVADYKSNYLGESSEHYTRTALEVSVAEHRYDMQYALYLLALHRQLRARLPGYDFDTHMGGAVYLYVRGVDGEGHGVLAELPPRSLIEQLDRSFAGIEEAEHA